VTAPTPEKIQRYEIPDYDYGVRKVTRPPREMDLVEYEDHLRHLKLAQIEALKEMNFTLAKRASTATEEFAYGLMSARSTLEKKIAALRKELEG
jgi:hypothetical protein